ncbi:hypothetical protein K2Z84_02285, partial [Candidatus Binatia bacterium]|nr:hypothetical protein [Candidatus Binatia bacterium]
GFDQVIALSRAAPKGWRNDATYRLDDGTIVAHQVLRSASGKAAFDVAGVPVGLTLAWPTASTGYSTLFLDNGGAGFSGSATVNLTHRAALDYRVKLDAARARRPSFVATARYAALDRQATDLLAAAAAAADEPTRGALGAQALDALAQCFELLLHDAGIARARTLAHGQGWWGVTIDRVDQYPAVVASVSDLVEGVAGDAHLRIVFDGGVPATDYDGIVDAALAQGIVVVGQILDSSAMADLTLAQWQARVREYVDHFPQIAVWEIGNEVNGEWLGANVREKLEYAAAYVKSADPSDTTMLTFYWQMGTAGSGSTALFQWIHDEVRPALKSNVDVVALSTWVGDAPLGIAFDEVYERLHALFPTQRLALGELGYWSPGTTRAWWWRSTTNPTTDVRQAFAEQMYAASFAFPYATGGVFWWYYYQEMLGGTPLWQSVNQVYRSVYFCDDADADGHCDWSDVCPDAADPAQSDRDGDGLGDACDLACPDGLALVKPRIALSLRDGPHDGLTIQGSLPAPAGLDPAVSGIHLLLESAGASVLDVQLGGPGAPAQFVARGSGYAYRDPSGAAGGVVQADLRRSGPGGGTLKLAISAREASLEGVAPPALRVLVDLGTACAETRAAALACTFATSGRRVACR